MCRSVIWYLSHVCVYFSFVDRNIRENRWWWASLPWCATDQRTLLLMMSFILRLNQTEIVLEHLKLFSEHSPGLVPMTTYLGGEFCHYEPNLYCSSCSNYIGTRLSSRPTHCARCKSEYDADSNQKKKKNSWYPHKLSNCLKIQMWFCQEITLHQKGFSLMYKVELST